MIDRKTASTITDAELDQLYELVAQLGACLADTYELTIDEVLTQAETAIADRKEDR
ncbi:hypothetical protein [Streptomyces sp. NPDC008240]|uniref:hypothetical protein n=1 Tax=Streptomyces sp. NPDC008240 TaxID=3364822 RepID=UPI0036E5CAC4